MTPRTYATPAAFKEALEQRLRSGGTVDLSVARMYVNTARELGFRLPPGQTVSLTVLRRSKKLTIHLTSPKG